MSKLSRFTDDELKLIEKTFKNNDPLLKAIRNHIFQLPLSVIEESLLQINVKGKKEILTIIRKKVLPEIEADVPFGLSSDLYLTIPVKDVSTEVAEIQICAARIWHDYLDQQLKLLEGQKVSTSIKLSDLIGLENKTPKEAHYTLLARNLIIDGTERILGTFNAEVAPKTETPEEKEARLKKDSNK